MGWAHDFFDYTSTDPIYRAWKHKALNFPLVYAFKEKYCMPLSHDLVAKGKSSLINRMYGSYEDKFLMARLSLFLMMTYPGKKLTFMGTEFAQFKEWDYQAGIDFCLLDFPNHNNMHKFVKSLNHLYLDRKELFEVDFSWKGFEWIVADDNNQNVLVFRRFDKLGNELIFAVNFSPVDQLNYSIGVSGDKYAEIFNSDNVEFGGRGITNDKLVVEKTPWMGKEKKLTIKIPALSGVFLVRNSKKIRLD
jgi:1,4-alpha-glucan branching enzyme